MRRLRCIGVATLAAGMIGLVALRAETARVEFQTKTWLTEDGLPNNSVNRLAFDHRGLLWLATASGLARFDGRSFREFTPPQLLAREAPNLRSFAVAGDTLYMLPASGGVVQRRNHQMSFHPATAACGTAALLDIFAEPDGTVWVGTGDSTVVRWHAGKTQTFGAAEGISRRGDRFTFAQDEHGTTWVSAYDFLGKYDGQRLVRYQGITGTALVICAAREGGLWVAGREQLARLTDNGVQVVARGSAWEGPEASGVQVVYEDRQRRLWVGTRRGGLFRVIEGRAVPLDLPNRIVNAIADDADGNLWVATGGGGLQRLRPSRVTLIDDEHGMTDDMSTGVCEDDRGALWCANRAGGVFRVFQGVAEKIAPPADGAPPYAVTVCPDHEGAIWIGASHGLFRAPVAGPRAMETIVRNTTSVNLLFCARDGTLWVGWGNGDLTTIRHGKSEPVNLPAGLRLGRIRSLAEDGAGRIWIAGDAGALATWQNGVLRTITPLPGGAIGDLYCDAEDNLWLGTSRGLGLKSSALTRLFTVADGLPDDEIAQVLEDGNGRLWCGSRRGIFWVQKSDLLRLAAGGKGHVTTGMVEPDDGVRGASALTNGQPRAWRGRSDELWFATYNGIVGVNPRDFPERPPPPLLLDEVLIDGRPIRALHDIRVSPPAFEIAFKLLSVDYTTPQTVRLRHRLVGFDPDWIETPDDRRVSYAGLEPGRYEFQVAASRVGTRWRQEPLTVAVLVEPRWSQTWWFRATMVLAFTGIVVWCARYWSHRRLQARVELLEREHALERERARIARDLHDDLGSSLTQVSMLADRIKRHATDGTLQTKLSLLAARTRRMSADLESIVWTVNPKNNTWIRLVAFLTRFAQSFCHDLGIACTVTVAEGIPAVPLEPETQHHILAVMKEALNNVVKHAQCTKVDVSLVIDGTDFVLQITDDGRGFDPHAPEHGRRNGLTNMRTRIASIGGTIKIESTPGNGSTILVRQPLDSNSRPLAATPNV